MHGTLWHEDKRELLVGEYDCWTLLLKIHIYTIIIILYIIIIIIIVIVIYTNTAAASDRLREAAFSFALRRLPCSNYQNALFIDI